MWDLIVPVPDHCVSFYFVLVPNRRNFFSILWFYFSSFLSFCSLLRDCKSLYITLSIIITLFLNTFMFYLL